MLWRFDFALGAFDPCISDGDLPCFTGFPTGIRLRMGARARYRWPLPGHLDYNTTRCTLNRGSSNTGRTR